MQKSGLQPLNITNFKIKRVNMRTSKDYFDFKYIAQYNFLRSIPTEIYPYILKYKYKKELNKELNLKNPKTFTEKIQWLKLYNKNHLKALLSDKLASKKYAKKLIPEINVAKVYDVSNTFESIDFSKCPNSFVLKTNHSWRTGSIVQNKSELLDKNYNLYSRCYKGALNINYAYWNFYELQYKDIKPMVFAEELLFNEENKQKITEYEAYCFNGKVEFVRICFNFCDNGKFYKRYGIWNRNAEQMNFALFFYINDKQLQLRSDFYKKVIEYSEILSSGIDFVRIDFLGTENKLYFLETTFTPFSGFIKFIPDEFDLYYGEKLDINYTL